jgi:hypothetical protein
LLRNAGETTRHCRARFSKPASPDKDTKMKIDAVEVTTSDMKRTVDFYQLLGFEFTDFKKVKIT